MIMNIHRYFDFFSLAELVARFGDGRCTEVEASIVPAAGPGVAAEAVDGDDTKRVASGAGLGAGFTGELRLGTDADA